MPPAGAQEHAAGLRGRTASSTRRVGADFTGCLFDPKGRTDSAGGGAEGETPGTRPIYIRTPKGRKDRPLGKRRSGRTVRGPEGRKDPGRRRACPGGAMTGLPASRLVTATPPRGSSPWSDDSARRSPSVIAPPAQGRRWRAVSASGSGSSVIAPPGQARRWRTAAGRRGQRRGRRPRLNPPGPSGPHRHWVKNKGKHYDALARNVHDPRLRHRRRSRRLNG